MSDGALTPKKAHPEIEDLEALPKNELIVRIKEQEQYIKQLECKRLKLDRDDDVDSSDRLKQQQKDAARRENTLVHRLTTKEQELQDFMTQITELKQAQTQGTAQLRSMLLDPAVNIVFQRMAKEMEEAQEKLKQTQNELSAWKFTPDSQTGKRLMARCQMLLQENEELGKTIASGRTAKLEGEIALQKTLVTEMKNNQSELDEFLGDLEEDVEGMQTMIYVLQQQLRESKEQITALEEENARLRSGDTSGGAFKTFSPKQRDKPEKTIKKEEKTHKNYNTNAYTEQTETDYAPMETGYYGNDRTDSDLEAEYSYEGLYENEDKYQEELETPQGAVEDNAYEYEENGYKQYDEEYDSQADYKNNYSENDVNQALNNEHEQMETDDSHHDNHSDRTKPAADHNVTNHKTKQQSTHTDIADVTNRAGPNNGHAAELNTKQSTVKDSSRQQPDSTDETNNGETTKHSNITGKTEQESKDTQHVHSTDDTSRTSNDSKQMSTTKERTSEREQIPSPKPSKVSPVKILTSKAKTPEKEAISNSDHSAKVSPSKDKSPIRPKSSPIRSAQDEGKDKGLVDNIKTTSNLTEDSSLNKDKSPGSFKEREPVLQKFLNGGVTSTVDDIEDL